jgi:hypothetical protein
MNACNSKKMGEYNMLRCCLREGHDGDHSYVVAQGNPYDTDLVKDKDELPFHAAIDQEETGTPTNHTSGPWIERGAYVVGGNPQLLIADCSCGRFGREEDDANARLIAAAPDLLAALKNALPLLERAKEWLTDEAYAGSTAKIRAAIAKATAR